MNPMSTEQPGGITLVLGASINPDKVSYEGVAALAARGLPVVAVGSREYRGNRFSILKEVPPGLGKVHTVSLYLSEQNQAEYYDIILSLGPERIIFNPGTKNPDLASLAADSGIEVVEACMLTMLQSGEF
jgi:predicted CoA-binding protein